jgi:hypothetical protein
VICSTCVKVVTLAKLELFPGKFDGFRWPAAQGAPKLFNLLKAII